MAVIRGLIDPGLKVLERGPVGDVVDEDRTDRANPKGFIKDLREFEGHLPSVIGTGYAPERLLP